LFDFAFGFGSTTPSQHSPEAIPRSAHALRRG
jgi:hypothetical protein